MPTPAPCSSPIPRPLAPTPANLAHFLVHITAISDPHTIKPLEGPVPEPVPSSPVQIQKTHNPHAIVHLYDQQPVIGSYVHASL